MGVDTIMVDEGMRTSGAMNIMFKSCSESLAEIMGMFHRVIASTVT